MKIQKLLKVKVDNLGYFYDLTALVAFRFTYLLGWI